MMERALKERIIGAVVLVVFAVLVVPIFLDGPPEDGEIVTERVLLPGQDDQKTQTVVLDRDRTEPVPAANAESVTEEPVRVIPEPARREEPKKIPTEPQEEPAKDEVADEPAASTTGMWAVQLGAFSDKEKAENLVAVLREQGYMPFLSQVATNTGTLHRVRIGPQKDRESAESMAARLLKVGHKGQVVPHP